MRLDWFNAPDAVEQPQAKFLVRQAGEGQRPVALAVLEQPVVAGLSPPAPPRLPQPPGPGSPVTHLVAVTQRVVVDPRHGERRDALDQRWTTFLAACGLVPVLLPNDSGAAIALMKCARVRGLIMTGGNTLAAYGGDAPERDRTELEALAFARAQGLAVLGVCRGMQLLLHAFDVPLTRVDGHAGRGHVVTGGRLVNSFHEFAAVHDAGPLTITASAADGVVESVTHPSERLHGVMWHPERADTFHDDDIALVRSLFREAA